MTADSWNAVRDITGAETDQYRAELLDYDVRRLNTVGPISYQGYLYALVRAHKPVVVIETGVRSGVSTVLILAAMGRNAQGELHSCDPCYASASIASHAIGEATGMSVSDRFGWWFYPGTSRAALPKMPVHVDMFVHDSDHGKENMAFELAEGWARLCPGGLLICDDWYTCVGAERHKAFETFIAEKGAAFFKIGSAAVVRKPTDGTRVLHAV